MLLSISYDSGKTTCWNGVVCCPMHNTSGCTTWKGAALGMYCAQILRTTSTGIEWIKTTAGCSNIYSVTITSVTNSIHIGVFEHIPGYSIAGYTCIPPTATLNSIKYVMNIYCVGGTTVSVKTITTIQSLLPHPKSTSSFNASYCRVPGSYASTTVHTTIILPTITSANGMYCNSNRAVISLYPTTKVNFTYGVNNTYSYYTMPTTYFGQITANYPVSMNCTTRVSHTTIYINGSPAKPTTQPQNPIVAQWLNLITSWQHAPITTISNTSVMNILVKTPTSNKTLGYSSDYFCVGSTANPLKDYIEILGFSSGLTTNATGCKQFSQKIYHTTVVTGTSPPYVCKEFYGIYYIGPAIVFAFSK